MMRSVPRVLVILGSLSLAVVGCSDDGDGPGGTADAATDAPMGIDAADPIDAPPMQTRQGTIRVLDLASSDPGLPVRGAVVDVMYADLTEDDVTPIFDERAGELELGCAVWVYDVGSTMPQPGADEGMVTISGTESPVGECSFDAASGKYMCSTGGGTLLGGMTGVVPQGDTADINLFYNGFQGLDLTGSFIRLEGFTNPENNGTFAVTAQAGDAGISIANPNAVNEALAADADFTVITGAGPTAAMRQFLGGDTASIMLAKEAGPEVPEINANIIPGGLGLTLDSESSLPHALPVAPAADVQFSCSPGMGGNCGVAVPPLYGLVISGYTTDGDTSTSTDSSYMPDPVTSWARFECRSQMNDPLVLPTAALQALLDTGATRIQTSFWRPSMNLSLLPDTDLFAGHGIVGYTDIVVP